jgi:hypothetical protein
MAVLREIFREFERKCAVHRRTSAADRSEITGARGWGLRTGVRPMAGTECRTYVASDSIRCSNRKDSVERLMDLVTAVPWSQQAVD